MIAQEVAKMPLAINLAIPLATNKEFLETFLIYARNGLNEMLYNNVLDKVMNKF